MQSFVKSIKQLLSTPRGRWIAAGVGIGAVVLLVVLVWVFVFNNRPGDAEPDFVYETSSETDPVSGVEIITDNTQPEIDGAGRAMVIGCSELIEKGMRGVQVQLLQDFLSFYAGSQEMELTRISCFPGSVQLTGPSTYEFNVMLNVDKEQLRIHYDASRSPRTAGNVLITAYDVNGNVVYRY